MSINNTNLNRSLLSNVSSNWDLVNNIKKRPAFNARSLGLSNVFKIRNHSHFTIYVYIMVGSFTTINNVAVDQVGSICLNYHHNEVEQFIPLAPNARAHLNPNSFNFNICIVVKHNNKHYMVVRRSMQRNYNYIIQDRDIIDRDNNILGGIVKENVFRGNIIIG